MKKTFPLLAATATILMLVSSCSRPSIHADNGNDTGFLNTPVKQSYMPAMGLNACHCHRATGLNVSFR